MIDMRKRKFDRVDFFGDYVMVFKNGIYIDIIVKFGGDGFGIFVYKFILVIFLNLKNFDFINICIWENWFI